MTLSRQQRKALKRANAARKYKALGYAYKLGPHIKWMLVEGYSQRDIVRALNGGGAPTPRSCSQDDPSSQRKWSLIQVQRLIKQLEEVERKMRYWYSWNHRKETALMLKASDASAQGNTVAHDSLMHQAHSLYLKRLHPNERARLLRGRRGRGGFSITGF